MLARQSLRASAALLGVAAAGYSIHQSTSPSVLRTAHADAPAGAKKVFAGLGFVELKLESAEIVNHNVRRLRFALPEGDTVTGLKTVSSLLSKHTPEGAWLPVIRPYTPIITDEPGYVTLLVKKYPNGRASGKLHSMAPGDTLSFKTLAEFPYKANEFTHLSLIAGGAGITPIYQLIRTVLHNPYDRTQLTLVYANNSEQDILLQSEFDELERRFPGRFRAVYTVSQLDGPETGRFRKGYVTREMLGDVLPDAKLGDQAKVLVSGPPPMTEAVAGAKGMGGWAQGNVGGILKELGWRAGQVYKF